MTWLSGDQDIPPRTDRSIKLRDLVSLGQVSVEVVLSRESILPVDRAVRGKSKSDGKLHDLPAEPRQRARVTERDNADL